MFKFGDIFKCEETIQSHVDAPLLEERLQYLEWWSKNGASKKTLYDIALNLLHASTYINFKKNIKITRKEVEKAATKWAYQTNKPQVSTKFPLRRRCDFIRIVIRWLMVLGRLTSTQKNDTPFSKEMSQFVNYMRDEQGLAEGTIELRIGLLEDFFTCILKMKINSLRALKIQTIDNVLMKKHNSSNYAQGTIRNYTSAIRIFLRFAESKNWCKNGLAESIKAPRVYSLASLPNAPSWNDAGRLIACTKGNNPTDIRDRAVLMLLIIYGMRNAEVRNLRLSDFDWEHNSLHLWRAKGRPQIFPLSQTVGKAVLRYINKARPDCLWAEVFISTNAPYRPLSRSAVYHIVRNRWKRLNVEFKHYGPHSLRHACASHLINTGISLKVIGNHLGHQCIESTRIYTKVDLVNLRKVAEFNMEDIL
jgi:integrase/recombinase XerD